MLRLIAVTGLVFGFGMSAAHADDDDGDYKRAGHKGTVTAYEMDGTTVLVHKTCLASGRSCALLWAGDSRVYRYRDAWLQQLTRDHSQVEELRAQGYLTVEEARNHPAHHLITRAVGAADWLELEEARVDLCDGDVLLICSDGLTNEVGDASIALTLALARSDCVEAAHALVEMALRDGGRDNVSVIVIRVNDPGATDRTLVNPSVAR